MKIRYLILGLLVIAVNLSLIPWALETYVYWNREELRSCFYPEPPQKPVYCPKTSPVECFTPQEASLGVDDHLDALEAVYATSTLIIDQKDIPALIQKIDLLGIDGEMHTLWKNEKESK